MVQDIVCYIQTNYFEVLSAIIALICVFLEIKQDILVWWISFVASLMYTWVFYDKSLYSSSVLHIFYAIMCIYGWWQWRKIREHTHTKKTVLRMPMHYYPVVLLTIVVLTPPVGYLNEYYQGKLPYWDAYLAVCSVVAYWLLAKKYLENWILWILTDTVYVVMYLYEGALATAVLYFAYVVLAISGLVIWRKDWLNTLIKRPISDKLINE